MKLVCATGAEVDFTHVVAKSETAALLVETLSYGAGGKSVVTLRNYRASIPHIAEALDAATASLDRASLSNSDDVDAELAHALIQVWLKAINLGAIAPSTVDGYYTSARSLLYQIAGFRQVMLPKYTFAPPPRALKLPSAKTIEQFDTALMRWFNHFKTESLQLGPSRTDLGMTCLAVIRLSGLNPSALGKVTQTSTLELLPTTQPVLLEQKNRAGEASILLGIPAANIEKIADILETYDRAAATVRSRLKRYRNSFWVWEDWRGVVKAIDPDDGASISELISEISHGLKIPGFGDNAGRTLRALFQREILGKRGRALTGEPIDRLGHPNPASESSSRYHTTSISDIDALAILEDVTEQFFVKGKAA